MTEREVTGCWGCPFAEKRDWSNEDDSGTDIEDCALGMPDEIPAYKAREELGYFGGPPAWCKLRTGDVLVKLAIKKPEPEEPE